MTLSRRNPRQLSLCQRARRVYLYWRKEQAFSPADARLQVAAFMKKVSELPVAA